VSARISRLRAFADACDADGAAEVRDELEGRLDEHAMVVATALCAAYPALRGAVRQRPDAVAAIAREGWRAPRKRAELVKRLLAACGGLPLDPLATRRGLRRATTAERLRIALRELEPDVEIDVTAREWSDLAEAQLEIALMEARGYVEHRFGPIRTAEGARNGFVVIGLGKLGGGELNAGSDVDILFLHESDEGTCAVADDREATRPFDAFTKIARRMVATLDEHDDDGFCARIDLRLRPEGASGPMVNSIASALGYYETFGRGWERAALLRARPVAGDLALGVHALSELSPFVYRRAVEPGVALEMMDMVQRARVELSEAPVRDLKLGVGGIREAEFFVQTLQLVWGGKDAAVRTPGMLEGLRRLRTRGYVTDREARGLVDGYLFLRRVEHRVQIASGVQTHLVPSEGLERDRLARTLGFKGGHELWSALERVRARIAERFASLAPGRVAVQAEERVDAILRALDQPSNEAERGDFMTSLRALSRRPDAPLGGRTRERHPRFARALVSGILDAADPDQAAGLVRTFFDRLSAPSVATYVRALESDERALSRFVGLCGASAYLGGSLVGHPELADLLLFSTQPLGADEARGARLLAEDVAQLTHAERIDAESFVGAMRRAKGALELGVGLADLAGELDTREASRSLSVMAEATVDAATSWALDEAARKRSLRALSGLAVLAMGKLGGREIGYGSDLDVVFVYDPSALDAAGVDPLEAGDIYGRVAARVIRLIGTPHEDGPGYELDTRLRPSGEQGHLVVSLDAFRAYHLGRDGAGPKAADWERQALLRLRPCAGDPRVGEAVAKIAVEAAYERGAPDAQETLRLRMRLEEEVARERPRRHDVKLGKGGLADVEFAVQLLQMRHGAVDASVRSTETLVALDALEAHGHLLSATATTLRDGYRFLRRLEQRARVVHGSKSALLDEAAPGLTPLARSMGYRDREGASASDQLMATYREVTGEVRAAFLELVRIASSG
jgi:glutamate-ammonia-ligase adenylyltransferase